MSNSIHNFVVHELCRGRLFFQALCDTRKSGDMVHRSIIDGVTSCTFLMDDDYGRHFPLGRKSAALYREVEHFSNIIEISHSPRAKKAGGKGVDPG